MADNKLMFDPDRDPLPLPVPIPGPWFPKYPQRASMSFGDFVQALNSAPADSPVWEVVRVIEAHQDHETFDALREALEAAEPPDDALRKAYEVPAIKAAMQASGGTEAEQVRLIHPFFLAVDWGLVQAP